MNPNSILSLVKFAVFIGIGYHVGPMVAKKCGLKIKKKENRYMASAIGAVAGPILGSMIPMPNLTAPVTSTPSPQ